MTAAAFLSASQFGELAGISERKARAALQACHDGGRWRGYQLNVRKVPGRGGPRGMRYEVSAASLVEAGVIAQDKAPSVPAVPEAPLICPPAPVAARHNTDDQAGWKLSIIQPIRLQTMPGTPERQAMIDKIAAEVRYPYGKKRGKLVGERTIRKWIADYDTLGLAGLMRKARTDAKSRRVVISRKWDELADAVGLGESERQAIAVEFRRHVASLWRSGTPSWPTVQMNARPFLMKLTRKAAGDVSDAMLRDACLVPRTLIDETRHFQAVAIRRKDAGRSAAIQTPRIRRDRSHLKPMEWVAGDVHHIDIAFRREDGSLCTIKAVAWMDLATNRTFITPFLMPKGQMIRREHVIQSFVELCTDPNWGIPTRLYVDNGGEYNWGEFVADLCKLKHLIEVKDIREIDGAAEAGMQKAKPYNPQAKVIETLFSVLERTSLSQLPGHIGGDRMKKKTENQGKDPVAYPGTLDDFCRSLDLAVQYYHCKPQAGHLKRKAPNDRFAELIGQGWASVTLDATELAVAFSREEVRRINAGGTFSWGGNSYRHDALIGLAGIGRVLVREPLFGDRERLFVFAETGEPLCVAAPEPVYQFGDVAGAGEQQRQASIFNRGIRTLERATDNLDLEEVMAEAVNACGTAPVARSDGKASINPQFREAAHMSRALPGRASPIPASEQRQRDKAAVLERLAAASGGLR